MKQDLTALKYLKALQDLHLILQNTSKISMKDFMEKQAISKSFASIIQKGGIIKQVKKGRFPEWEWCSIEPNLHMAKKTLERSNALMTESKTYISKRKRKATTNVIPRVKVVDYYEVSLLFGIFKIQVKPHYKFVSNEK